MGQDTRKRIAISKFNLATMSASIIGKPFELGCTDCFMLVINYLRQRGVSLPEEHSGYTLQSYPELYQTNPNYAREVMVSCLDSILSQIPANRVAPGDILLIKLKGTSEGFFLAINGGNGNALMVSEIRGVISLPMRVYKILKGWTYGWST